MTDDIFCPISRYPENFSQNGQIWSNFAIKADNGNMKIASIEPDKIFKSSYNEF